MHLRKNILANYFGALTIVVVPLIAIPWYLSVLGADVYGLISFIATLQALLGLLDAGLSQALTREFVFFSSKEGNQRASYIFYMAERFYWIFALVSAGAVVLFAKTITETWLKVDTVLLSNAKLAVYGAAALFLVQFPGALYRSLLVGTQDQVLLNKILVSGVLLKHIGAMLLLIVWPCFFTYLAWHILITLAETIVRGTFAWRAVGGRGRVECWNPEQLKSVYFPMISLVVSILLGALTVQMDKIILSNFVPVDLFGYYCIASTIAAGALQLVYPLTQAVLPRLVQLQSQPNILYALNLKLTKSIAVVVLAGFLGYVFFGKLLLGLWLYKTPQALVVVYPLLTVLLIGTAFNAFYNVGYCNWLAHKSFNRIIFVNLASLLLLILFTPILIREYGAIGATFGWLAINTIGLLMSLGWIKRK